MKRFYTLLIAVAALVTVAAQAHAQSDVVELLRSDLKTEKKAILTESLAMTEAQSQKFWPLYREFEMELDKLNDARLPLMTELAANNGKLTADKMKDIAGKIFDNDADRLSLMKKYFKKVSKDVSVDVAARFVQVEGFLQNLMRLKIASEMPLIKMPADAKP
jgi:hypothetical protein